METADRTEEDNNKIMDFESGIDKWVIDKEDLEGSSSLPDEHVNTSSNPSFELIAMDKENIKRLKSSTEHKSLRNFRIRKHMNYQELSSDSEGDSKRKASSQPDDSFWNKKKRLESSQMSLHKKGSPMLKLHHDSSTSLNPSNEKRKDKESLSSVEISAMLRDRDDSMDSLQEKNRERLHSIENVSALIDNKDKSGDSLSTSLKFNFTCSFCCYEYQSLEELSSHENEHRRGNLPIVSKPPEHFVNQTHKKSQTSKIDIFWNKTDFLSTFKTHLLNRGVIPLDINKSRSPKYVKSEIILEKSLETKTNTTFKCDKCNSFFPELLILKSHQILFHSEKKVLFCEYCNYQTTQCANLATHLRIHFQLDCPHCNFQCSLKSSLEAHLDKYHPNNYYQCDKCDYQCKSQTKFQKHITAHSISDQFQCGECKLYFAKKKDLRKHIKNHLSEKEIFKCDKCDLSFSQKHHLKLHRRNHKQFTCDICKSSFSQKIALKSHMRVHTQQSFKCEKCNVEFSKKNDLKLHMRMHIPKKCQHCTFKSSESSEFSKHICINKLYDVQKRSLNFSRENSASDTEHIGTNYFGKQMDHDLNSSMSVKDTKNTEIIQEKNDKPVSVKKVYKKQKHRKSVSKISSLRQNLPSRNNQRINFIGGSYEPHKKPKKPSKSKRTSNRENRGKKVNREIRDNVKCKEPMKQSSWIVRNRCEVVRRQVRGRKRIKKEILARSLNCAQILFNKKPSFKDLFIEPIRFVNENYVECFYQNQETISQDHLEVHLRQRSLLSCRLCRFKTNSEQLLQRHEAKNHTWVPAVVKMLFS